MALGLAVAMALGLAAAVLAAVVSLVVVLVPFVNVVALSFGSSGGGHFAVAAAVVMTWLKCDPLRNAGPAVVL